MKAAVYMRVSSERQRENETIETQRDYTMRYLALHEEIEVVDWYEDDGISASKPINISELPAGARLLSDARAGKFEMVLLYKLDRLGRNARLILNGVGELEAAGQRVVSMKDVLPVDTASPAGRLMLAVLAGVAGFERDTFVERAMDGSNRLAREGAWLGGSAPYGYKVEGRGRHSRLVINDELIPGTTMSEADVVRLIFRLTVEERLTCPQITERLHALGIPPAYGVVGRQYRPSLDPQTLSGMWRYGRIRHILVTTTYKGIHRYGKNAHRKDKQPRIIERPVPPLVSEEEWARAQDVLKSHWLYNPRGAKRNYLLRGLIKCAECGHSYIGKVAHGRTYYACNGRHNRRWIGPDGKACGAKSIPGDIEDKVWADIEGFLRNPGPALEALRAELLAANVGRSPEADLANLDQTLEGKKRERDTVVTLYRRGRIDEAALERQLDQIAREEEGLRRALDETRSRADSNASAQAIVRQAETLLGELRARLDGELTWEDRRDFVELLVRSMTVTTDHSQRKPEAKVDVVYAFAPAEREYTTENPTVNRSGICWQDEGARIRAEEVRRSYRLVYVGDEGNYTHERYRWERLLP
jgi:site-specific DNA recombinase